MTKLFVRFELHDNKDSINGLDAAEPMAESKSGLSGMPNSRVQKRLRKGTHSCTECRRRKIRCYLQPGASICLPCSTRGSRCISQQVETNVVVGEDESVALDSTATFSDIETNHEETDNRVPLTSIFDDAELLLSANIGIDGTPREQMSQASTSTLSISTKNAARSSMEGTSDSIATSYQIKFLGRDSKSLCETLRALLPIYDKLMLALRTNGGWWNNFRQKTHMLSSTPFETLVDYATRVYTSNNPAELGTLVIAYARSVDKNNLYTIVDNLVLSDFIHSTTIEGMECLILLAKSYTDIGQPRRAWFIWRKGMAIAQLMGIYRENINSPRNKSIWWSLYHGDRFSSMLLGLPYGFNDAHLGIDLHTMVENSRGSPHYFVLRCAFIAGKVIDRNITPGRLSFAKALNLDEEMEAIAASMPRDWWKLPPELPAPSPELEDLREHLLQQYYFFHVRIYIHLPFLAKSTTPSPQGVSRLQCMESARQLLRRYQMLRTKTLGAELFDCKTNDFVAFTAAIVLLIGLYSSDNKPELRSLKDDLSLITSIERIFTEDSGGNGSQLASQCQKTISALLGMVDDTSKNSNSFSESLEIRIPYFGTVVRRITKQATTHPVEFNTSNHNDTLLTPESQETTFGSVTIGQNNPVDIYMLDYMGNDTSNHILGTMNFGTQTFDRSSTHDQLPWLDQAIADIDQDWNMFLESNDMGFPDN